MTTFVLGNTSKVWAHKYALDTSVATDVALDFGAEANDVTTFDQTTRIAKGGIQSVGFAIDGFYDPDTFAAEFFSQIGTTVQRPISFSAASGGVVDGSIVYFTDGLYTGLSQFGPVGEMAPFSVEGNGNTPLVRGSIARTATDTSTQTGTGVQEGLVAAGNSLFAALHVTAVSGTNPTLAVTVESDDNAGFSSATTRLTFGTKTVESSEFTSVAGNIANDDYWRIVATIGGTSPSFTYAVHFGIASTT